jgi:hypothetical protein
MFAYTDSGAPGQARCPGQRPEAPDPSSAGWRLERNNFDEAKVEAEIKNLVAGIESMRTRHLALWRVLPERLALLHAAYSDPPADTRVYEDTMWHRADTMVALTAADIRAGAAFLSFALARVQTFIQYRG